MTTDMIGLSADELIAKGIAPVSREYWKPLETREAVTAVGSSQASDAGKKTDKKSRKQFKKVRVC